MLNVCLPFRLFRWMVKPLLVLSVFDFKPGLAFFKLLNINFLQLK